MKKKNTIIEHQIRTMEDVFTVLDGDNCERFFIDFCIYVNQVQMFKDKYPELIIDAMLWTDDGVHEITGVSINGDLIKFKGNVR